MTRSQWLAFAPRDTMLVRDGRQFNAGADVVAEATLPSPSTVAGAVRTAYGGRCEDEPVAVRGPLFAVRSYGAWTTYLPTPQDVIVPTGDKPHLSRLRPQPLPGVVTDLSAECPQWLMGEGDPAGGWVDGDVMTRYLAGDLFPPGDDSLVIREEIAQVGDAELFGRELRVGLARERSRVAKEGLLYQATHLRPVEGMALLAECELPDGRDAEARGPAPLGGLGRLAEVDIATGVEWPQHPSAYPDGNVLVYVATPAIWAGGWRLPLPADAKLVAAAVATPMPVASASPRDGMDETRSLRWAVPPGSVYLVSFADGAARAAEWAHEVHGKAHGRAARDRLGTAGFGVILTGVWS